MGENVVWLGPDKTAFFVVRDFDERILEVRTARIDHSWKLSAPLVTYDFEDSRHFTVLLDEKKKTWLMYYLNGSGNSIRVKSAPVSSVDLPALMPR